MLDNFNAVIQRVRIELYPLVSLAKATSKLMANKVIGWSIVFIAELYKDYSGKIKDLIL